MIAPIVYALHRSPSGFQETRVVGVWLARTKLRMNGPDIVLSYSVRFRILEAERMVVLLHAEATPVSEMTWPDGWGEEPF